MNLDRIYTEFVLGKVPGFRFVHPTALTLIGLGMDFVVLYAVWTTAVWLLAVSLFVRYSCDCLDGAVARRYGKVSDLGGVLDTVADNTLIFIISLCLARLAGCPWYGLVAAVVTGANLLYLWREEALVHHANIKRGGTPVKDIYKFGVNNNILVYLGAFIALWSFL